MPHIHYTCDITATNVSHHTHCIDITPSLYDITIGIYIYSIICTIEDITSSLYDVKPPCLCHHTHYIWYHVHCICVITSTVFVISHQLCSWDHIRYNSWHHIHCIWHDSHCMTSQPMHSWYQIPYIWHHLQDLWHLVPYTCNITDTMFVNTCQLYLTSNTRC